MAGAIVLVITYGYPVKEHNDPIVDAVEAAAKDFGELMKPGAFMVDTFPLRESRFVCQLFVRVLTVFFFLPSNPFP